MRMEKPVLNFQQEKVPFEVTITEQEAVLETGDVTVRYDRTVDFTGSRRMVRSLPTAD